MDGAIHRAGGPDILEECRNLRATRFPDGLPTGGAVLTTAGRMPARHVIHTVGPVYGSGGSDKAEKLAQCYRNSLGMAAEQGLATVAFPAISTGIFGYPMDEAAAVSSRAIEEALRSNPPSGRSGLCSFCRGTRMCSLRHQVFDKHHRID